MKKKDNLYKKLCILKKTDETTQNNFTEKLMTLTLV